MGLTAIISSMSSGASEGVSAAISLLSPTGVGVGGIFVAAAVILLLAGLDLLDASKENYGHVQTMLLTTTLPLLVTLGGIVLFKSLQVV